MPVHLMRAGALVLACLLPWQTSLAAGRCERLVATGGADNPPFLWEDPAQPGRLVGAHAELLQNIAATLGVKLDLLASGDASQALDEVASGRADLLLDVPLREALLTRFDFVHPPLAQRQHLAWVRQDPAAPETLEALAGLNGVRVPGPDAAPLASGAPEPAPREHGDLSRALQQLAGGEIDYLVHPRQATIVWAAELGLLDRIRPIEPPLASESLHLALAHDSACNDAWLRGQLALRMTALVAGGVPQRLVAEHLDRWLAAQHDAAAEPILED